MAHMMDSLSFVVGLFMNLWSAPLCVSSIGTPIFHGGLLFTPTHQKNDMDYGSHRVLRGLGRQTSYPKPYVVPILPG